MKKITILIIAVVIAVLGVKLSRYAEADDAPGGVVVGWLLVAGGVVLGVKALLPRGQHPAPPTL
jgi:hypothetical protein